MGEKDKKEKKSKKKDKEGESAAESAAEEAPAAAKEEAAPAKEAAPKKAGRATSNVFALFNQAQIQEFKEAFTMMDTDRDGFLNESDLAAIYQQTGRDPDPKILKEMIAESPGQLNFTNFLSLFGEKLHGTDPENTLRDAFKMFDEQKTGKLSEEYIKELLSNVGDPFTKDELKQTWKEAPIEGGQLDYNKFVTIIKRGNQDDAE